MLLAVIDVSSLRGAPILSSEASTKRSWVFHFRRVGVDLDSDLRGQLAVEAMYGTHSGTMMLKLYLAIWAGAV
jgi:hypothetical protein